MSYKTNIRRSDIREKGIYIYMRVEKTNIYK